MVEVIVYAIDDGAIGEYRRKALSARFDHRGLATDIQKALVLAGKASIRKVFRGRRAAYRDGHANAALAFEAPIGIRNFPSELGIARGVVDELACSCGAIGEERDIVVIKIAQEAAQFLPSDGCGERVAIGLGRQRKSVG